MKTLLGESMYKLRVDRNHFIRKNELMSILPDVGSSWVIHAQDEISLTNPIPARELGEQPSHILAQVMSLLPGIVDDGRTLVPDEVLPPPPGLPNPYQASLEPGCLTGVDIARTYLE